MLSDLQAVPAFLALGHQIRLDAFRLLVRAGADGLPSGEIAALLGVPPTAMSFHLANLERAGLVASRRDGRNVRYAVSVERVRDLVTFLTADCCGGHPELCAAPARPARASGHACDEGTMPMGDRIYHVLFLCTGNSARSILAEAILTKVGGTRFRAHSAGSRPKGDVNPFALRLLAKSGFDTAFARSKSWDEFAAAGAPPMDFVFTVCDSAAAEDCPVWPGQPMTAHWGVPDPAAVDGTDAEKAIAFAEAFRQLSSRISVFASLPVESLDRLSLQRRLDEIGRTGAETLA